MQNTLANRQKPFSLRQMPTTLVLALTVLWLSACSSERNGINEPLSCIASSPADWVAGGQFSMGSNTAYPEESPSTIAEVHGYWMDATEVTVGSFKAFVDATSYVTVAERSVDPSSFPGLDISTSPELAYLLEPGGAVFAPAKVASGQATNWWVYVPGANWRFPLGPDAPAAHSDEPVTQVALEDAKAYARWAGGAFAYRSRMGICCVRTRRARGVFLRRTGQRQCLARHLSCRKLCRRRFRRGRAGRVLPGEWFRPSRHDWQRLGVDRRRVSSDTCARLD